ncbi:uncharacterized protein L201_008035 [Kwoniella dendrophila CBS 6074]|uniref:Uncharacterized protein n=1 Tax=Kwoniella dendrophila CBS 6074 TaxID=1295534 RepID=A0AAX4K671_9TREE
MSSQYERFLKIQEIQGEILEQYSDQVTSASDIKSSLLRAVYTVHSRHTNDHCNTGLLGEYTEKIKACASNPHKIWDDSNSISQLLADTASECLNSSSSTSSSHTRPKVKLPSRSNTGTQPTIVEEHPEEMTLADQSSAGIPSVPGFSRDARRGTWPRLY